MGSKVPRMVLDDVLWVKECAVTSQEVLGATQETWVPSLESLMYGDN